MKRNRSEMQFFVNMRLELRKGAALKRVSKCHFSFRSWLLIFIFGYQEKCGNCCGD
jgi:hypothetical protein